MCGIKSKSLWVPLVGFLLLLPVFSWAGGSAEESNVELTDGKPESLYMVSESELKQLSSNSKIVSTELTESKKLVTMLKNSLTELAKETTGLKQLLTKSKQQLEISYEEIERLKTILNKTVPIVAVSTGVGVLIVGVVLGYFIGTNIGDKP